MFGGTCYGQVNEIVKLITKEILKHLIVVDFFFLVRHSRSILKMAGMWYFTNSNTNFSAKYFK